MARAELAQCKRCGSFTLMAVDPVKVAVDVSPLDGAQYTAAIIGRVELYTAEKRQNGGQELRTWAPGSAGVSFGDGGAQNGTQRLHRQHACGAEYSKAVKAAPKAPEAPVTPGGHRDGSRPPAARDSAAQGRGRPSPATTANPRRSSHGARCHICRKLIDQAVPFTGIFHERWIWAVHEECE